MGVSVGVTNVGAGSDVVDVVGVGDGSVDVGAGVGCIGVSTGVGVGVGSLKGLQDRIKWDRRRTAPTTRRLRCRNQQILLPMQLAKPPNSYCQKKGVATRTDFGV